MNAADRKKVDELKGKLETLIADFDEIKSELRDLADAEQEKYDNLSEGLQGSDQGQAIEAAATVLDTAAEADTPQEALDELENLE